MEGLRAYAAFIVFFVHFAIISAPTLGLDLYHPDAGTASASAWMLRYLLASYHGVDVFFLLSGYLITGMAIKDRFDYTNFLIHRAARIYPALVAALLAFGLFHGAVLHDKHIGVSNLVANILLLNGVFPLSVEPIDSVTWSLFFEVAFYLSFPMLLALSKGSARSRLAISSAIALPIIIVLTFADGRYIRFVMFFAGAWLRILPPATLERYRPPEWVTLTLYLAATTSLIWSSGWARFILIFTLPAFLLADCVLHGRGSLSKFFALRPLRLFGNISYSFYLLHPAGIVAARYCIDQLHVRGMIWALAVGLLGFAISTILAGVSFLLFERPYFILMRQAQQKSASQAALAR